MNEKIPKDLSVQILNISKRYGEQLALDDVSLSIRKGEIIGLIGPNGAGKSTLMKILTGYLAPDSGSVEVHGFDVASEANKVRRIIGYLPEHNPLYPEMYIREYLEYAAGIYALKKNAEKRIAEVISLTGLAPEIHKRIGALSKGFRQRVGLAQALLHDPPILILDEPTSGLDPNQIVEIRNLIRQSGENKTIILSTHIMQEVEAICNRVVIINKGKIVADDHSGKLKQRQEKNVGTVIVEFDQTVEKQLLEELPFAEKVLNTSENNWLIQAGTEEDIRAEIFEFAVRQGLKVLSMQKQMRSLEEVFRSLTSK